jgi:hypothetical protein
VNSIHDHETASSQCVVGEDFDAVPAKRRVADSTGGIVNLDDDITGVVDKSQFLLLSDLFCLVEDISCGYMVRTNQGR